MYTPYLLYLFMCQWTFRFFHTLAIMNSVAMNIRVHASFQISFVWIYVQEWNCWIMVALFLVF